MAARAFAMSSVIHLAEVLLPIGPAVLLQVSQVMNELHAAASGLAETPDVKSLLKSLVRGSDADGTHRSPQWPLNGDVSVAQRHWARRSPKGLGTELSLGVAAAGYSGFCV